MPGRCYEIMASGVEREGKRVATLLSALLRFLGMKDVMLSVFSKMLDSSFGEDAGFRSTKHCISKEEVQFDINYEGQLTAENFWVWAHDNSNVTINNGENASINMEVGEPGPGP